ncbi:MAG TPA: hypothetical protein VNC59_06420, partial [Thermoanaerobaculia bacterium]|nr:hypothetical protein [Thermoanaerobaculia bacterium]
MQLPHESFPPQPLSIVPQVLPVAAHVVGTQARPPKPQTPSTPPPPHVWGQPQLPQEILPPQPLSIVPQVLPSVAHVLGMHWASVAAAPSSRTAAIPVASNVIRVLAALIITGDLPVRRGD